jgi:hypothetical protein
MRNSNAVVANAGMAEIQIKQLKFRGLGMDTNSTPPTRFAGTETAAEVKSRHSEDDAFDCAFVRTPLRRSLVWRTADVEADLMIEGVRLVEQRNAREVAPAIEIVDVDPSPYVITPATSQKPLEFKVKLKNHLPSDFRGSCA